jgi:hypothetical protein
MALSPDSPLSYLFRASGAASVRHCVEQRKNGCAACAGVPSRLLSEMILRIGTILYVAAVGFGLFCRRRR